MLNVLPTIGIRAFIRKDLDSVLEIQNACEISAGWGAHDYRQLLADPRGMILVAELEGQEAPKVLGFSVFYLVDEEAELWNIAVTPRCRRQGVARSLLLKAFPILAGAGARKVFLEVRCSNAPAMELYNSIGFTLLARRKDYYQKPREDALVLVRKLLPEPED